MVPANLRPDYAARFLCHGGLFGGGGMSSGTLLSALALAQATQPQAPPPANPAIAASSQVQPGAMAKNARVAAGLAGAFDGTLLTGPGGAAPATGGGAKSVVGA